jgi:hypothetical protein
MVTETERKAVSYNNICSLNGFHFFLNILYIGYHFSFDIIVAYLMPLVSLLT